MSEVEVLSHDEFWQRWSDPHYRAKRAQKIDCYSCDESPCVCGEAAKLLAEISSAPVVEFDLRTGAYQIHHGEVA